MLIVIRSCRIVLVSVRVKPTHRRKAKMQTMEYIDRGQGSSDRALEAAQNSTLPKIKAISVLRKMLKTVKPTTEQLKKFIRSLPREWHHTGLYGKRTEFYNFSGVTRKSFARWASPAEIEILAAKNETRERVQRFVAKYGGKFVVQAQDNHGNDWQSKGYKAQLEWDAALSYNSSMEDMGLFGGYDSDSNSRRLHDTFEAAEKAMATRKASAAKVQAENPTWQNFDKPLRVITVREDMANKALYFSAGALFERFGTCSECV